MRLVHVDCSGHRPSRIGSPAEPRQKDLVTRFVVTNQKPIRIQKVLTNRQSHCRIKATAERPPDTTDPIRIRNCPNAAVVKGDLHRVSDKHPIQPQHIRRIASDLIVCAVTADDQIPGHHTPFAVVSFADAQLIPRKLQAVDGADMAIVSCLQTAFKQINAAAQASTDRMARRQTSG